MALAVSGDRITELMPGNTAGVAEHPTGRQTPTNIKAALAVSMAVEVVGLLLLIILTVILPLIMEAQEENLAEKAETRMALVSPGPLLPRIYSNFTH